MNLGDAIREMNRPAQPQASEFFLEAKRQVLLLARQGRIVSPEEAWRLTGHSEGLETLWSVAFAIGTANDVSPQEICSFLESQFPRFAKGCSRPAPTWDELRFF